ncbi:cell wall protein DAN4-like [Alosa sapidissima]|uniref:cell wall protein DAN4-like n=1 Tax=Alosa sapidissima TaxID=34773 RepID=UPI001C08FAE1|nr:cell wall protein DAN4-like [Alosa sapidissima]
MAAYKLSTEITNLNFSDSLLDPSSNYYISIEAMVNSVLTQTYNITGGTEGYYLGTADMKFTKGQQINVDTTMLFISPNPFNIILLRYLFTDYMTRTTSTPFTINFFNTLVAKTTVPTTTTTTTTTRSPSTKRASQTTKPEAFSSMKPDSETSGTNSSAITTPSQNHTTDWASTASGTPTTTKPTPIDQRGSKTTGTTPYPLVPYWLDWVPGWGIALLVLASLILLLLIILIILLLLRWCCMDEPEEEPQLRYDPYSHEPYSSHSPAKTPTLKHMVREMSTGI